MNPSPGDRRRGPRRRDRHDAQRDEPGQRRLAVDDPRELLARGVQPHRAPTRSRPTERLPVEATHMLIAGAIDFVVFLRKRNDYDDRRRADAGSSRASARSTGVDGRVLSSEVFAPDPDGRAAAARADRRASTTSRQHGYQPAVHGRWCLMVGIDRCSRSCSRRRRRAGRLRRCARRRRARPDAPRDEPPAACAWRNGREPHGVTGPAVGIGVLVVAGWRTRWLVLAVGARPARRRSGTGSSAAPREERARSSGWRGWRPGPSRCATRSPARSGWSRRSRRPRSTRPRRSGPR